MTPEPKRQKTTSSTPVAHKIFSPSAFVKRHQTWSIYKVKRRIVFDDVTPEGVAIGTLITVPSTPDKTYKQPGLPIPTDV